MHKFLTVAMLASLLALTACATVEQSGDQASTAAPAAKASYSDTITGTRIPSRGTSQTLSTTEGSTYERDSRGKAAPTDFK